MGITADIKLFSEATARRIEEIARTNREAAAMNREAAALNEEAARQNDALAAYVRGCMAAREGDYAGAMNHFDRAMKLDPTSPAAQMRAQIAEIFAYRNTDLINP
ncbi:MAG: tetratricopeptide repeat protein [Bacteroidaceae bacterium]|nr:tetratricopeptide repeat protein [Bacteroidaceae bacterium]